MRSGGAFGKVALWFSSVLPQSDQVPITLFDWLNWYSIKVRSQGLLHTFVKLGDLMLIALILMTFVSVGIWDYLAKKKRRNKPFWISLGALLGPIAVVILLLLSNRS